jgi:hypothetical protein
MARVVHAVDVEIKGELDPSLAKAVNMTDAEFKRLQSAAKTFNSLMSKMTGGMPREATTAQTAVNSALSKMESRSEQSTRHMRENFEKIGEAGKKSAEKIQSSLAHAFDSIVEKGLHLSGIGGLLAGIGGAFAGEEFVRGAFEVRAERGVLQNQLRSVTEASHRGFLAPQIDTLIRNMEGRETPVRYKQMLETSTLLLSAAPNRFKDIGSMHKMLGQLADVSRDPEAFSMVSQAFTRILAEGKVDQQHLNEMSVDTGFAFKKAMSDALKVTPEQLSEMIKKHKLGGEKSIDALMKAFDLITGPGGAAYKHGEAQLAGLAGLQSRFIGHWEDFQESFGMQLENFISPIAEKVFALLTPAALTHAFDQMTSFTKSFGSAIGELISKLGAGKAASEIQAIGNALGQMIGKLFGTTNFGAFFKEVQDPISGMHTVMTATGQAWQDMISTKWADNIANALKAIRDTVTFIQSHFDQIKNTLLAVFAAMAAAKLAEVGAHVLAFASGIFNIGRAVINVASGGTIGAGNAAAEGAGKAVAEGAGAAGGGSMIAGGLARAGIASGMFFGQAQIAENQRPLEMAWLQKFGLSVENATRVLDAAWARIPGLDGQFGGLGTAINNSTQALAGMATKILALPFAGIGAAIGQLEAAVSAAASGVSAHEAAIATLPKGPGAAVPSAVPAPAPHAAGGIVVRPHVGLIGEAGPEAIIPLKKGGGGGLLGSITVNSNPVIHIGPGAAPGDLREALREHAREIAAEVRRIFEIQAEQSAVV